MKTTLSTNHRASSCETCQFWKPEHAKILLPVNPKPGRFLANAVRLELNDTPDFGACIISTRTDITGNTCYLRTHRTAGTFCQYQTPSFSDTPPQVI